MFLLDGGISDVEVSRNRRRTCFLVAGQEASVPMRLRVEITRLENECHFVAFDDGWFPREVRYILPTTDLPCSVLVTLNLK